MAEILVKSIKSENKPKESGLKLDDIPKQEKSENKVKNISENQNKRRTVRAGIPTVPPSKLRFIENGKQIK